MNLTDYEPLPKKRGNIPKYPLYGYDNARDIDCDIQYIKEKYPMAIRKLLLDIEDECDKLEYEGSFMFDTYPDPLEWNPLVDKIYDRYLEHEEEIQKLEANQLVFRPPGPGRPPGPPHGPGRPPGPPHGPGRPPGPPHGPGRPPGPPHGSGRPPGQGGFPPMDPGPVIPPRPCGPGMNCRQPRPDYQSDGQPNWLRNLISVLLSNEMLSRRRRYRSRKQWI